jgi:hypothetical protein
MPEAAIMSHDENIQNDPFARAYGLIRGELATATRATGSQIRVDETAKTLGISPTPVREALAKLAGERLVRRSRRHGYFVPHLSAGELVELYGLAEIHLLGAIKARLARELDGGKAPEPMVRDNAAGIARLFILILAGSRNSALLDTGSLIIERLAGARLVEDPAVAQEVEKELATLLHERRFERLSKEIGSYHATRRANALSISQAIREREEPQEKYFRDMI